MHIHVHKLYMDCTCTDIKLNVMNVHVHRPVGWGGALGAFAPPILAERPVKIQVYSVY